MEPRSQRVGQGQTVTLDCVADGHPQPVISWRRGGAGLQQLSANDQRISVLPHNHSLRSAAHSHSPPVLTPSLWEGAVGPEVCIGRGQSPEICCWSYEQTALTYNQRIITQFLSQMSSYIHQKCHLGEGQWGPELLLGEPPPLRTALELSMCLEVICI